MSDDLDLSSLDQRHEPDPEFRAALRRRLMETVARDRSTSIDRGETEVHVTEFELAPRPVALSVRRRTVLGIFTVAGAAAAAAVTVIAVLIANDDRPPVGAPNIDVVEPPVQTPTPSQVTTTSGFQSSGIEPSFAAAVEAAGLLSAPSPDEVALASDQNLYQPDSGPTQVSAGDNYVSLRTCRPSRSPSSSCSSGWAYMTGSVDGAVVHRGLLGQADLVEAYVLDDRYFVVIGSAPASQAAPVAWLIDSESGGHAELTWRNEPTTVSVPEQALVLFDDPYAMSFTAVERFLPRVVDARNGTIGPLSVPDDALADLPVAQHGTGRIWVGTAPFGPDLGVAYSDNGGATWTKVALPPQLRPTSEQLAGIGDSNDKLLSIAADGDRIAATFGWPYSDDRNVYVSVDAGHSWSTATPSETAGNGAHLYVLADKRLLLVWSIDPYPSQLLASKGSDWVDLEDVHAPQAIGHKYFSMNQAGIFLSYSFEEPAAYRIDFSADLRNWRTIATLDE